MSFNQITYKGKLNSNLKRMENNGKVVHKAYIEGLGISVVGLDYFKDMVDGLEKGSDIDIIGRLSKVKVKGQGTNNLQIVVDTMLENTEHLPIKEAKKNTAPSKKDFKG